MNKEEKEGRNEGRSESIRERTSERGWRGGRELNRKGRENTRRKYVSWKREGRGRNGGKKKIK